MMDKTRKKQIEEIERNLNAGIYFENSSECEKVIEFLLSEVKKNKIDEFNDLELAAKHCADLSAIGIKVLLFSPHDPYRPNIKAETWQVIQKED